MTKLSPQLFASNELLVRFQQPVCNDTKLCTKVEKGILELAAVECDQ